MKNVLTIAGGLLAVLAFGMPATAAVVWSDGVNLPYSSATVDIEGEFDNEVTWAGGSFKVLDGTGSQVPAGWKFAQQNWNGSANWAVASSTNLTEGNAAMKMTPGGGDYNDIFAGTFITGLTVGGAYTLTFDFQADVGFDKGNPGLKTGDDHQPSASFNVMNVADNPVGWGATEDYPGHVTGSTWIGLGNWDGNYHQQSRDFVATAETMAFVIKIRSMNSPGSVRLDNLVVTPEPAAMILLALGGLACLYRRR